MGAIGLGLDAPRPVAAFDPAQLFAGGEAGGWYDPAEPLTLFADPGRSVPATIDEPVGGMADRSGRGHHLAQANAAARPILRRDAAGRRYLQFDGADDFLASAAAGLLITGPLTLAAAIRRDAAGRYDIWMSAQTGAGSVNQYELRTDGAGIVEFVAAATEHVKDNAGAGNAVAAGANRVVTATRTGSAIEFRAGGAPVSRPHTLVPTSDGGSEFRLGDRKGSSLFAQGRIYGALVVDRVLTSREMAELGAFLSARSGIA